jgi:cobalt-zinc-cadmium efflux system protein
MIACGSKITLDKLQNAILLLTAVLIFEVIGGVLSNSLALLSDAAHVFSDILALGLSLMALRFAMRPPNSEKSFGFHRTEILAALVNGATLLLVSAWIFYEAYQRILQPQEVKSITMLIVAFVGFAVNMRVVWSLEKVEGNSLNIRSALLHALGDALASVGVIIGAVLMALTGIYVIDPLISVGIGIIIAFGSIRILRESLHIFLEGTPTHLDAKDVIASISKVSGVKGVHDLHIWSICSNLHMASAHVLVDDVKVSTLDDIKDKVREQLKNFEISHATLEFECVACKEEGIPRMEEK